jgi:hypothetical protein
VSETEEFAIFDQADLCEIKDKRGNLYGIEIGPDPHRVPRVIGTLGQEIAEFPFARPNERWHGFPLAPLRKRSDRRNPPDRGVPREALTRMVETALITRAKMKRYAKGARA